MGNLLSGVVFQPPRCAYDAHLDDLIWLKTESHRLFPALHFSVNNSQLTILYSHGNAEDLGLTRPWLILLAKELNINLMTYEYEAYGLSKGTEASETLCYENIDAAYAYLINRGTHPSNIVLFGRSLGSGPSCYLANRLAGTGINIGGLILQSPLLSVFRVLIDLRFTLPGDMFPNIDYITGVKCPVLVIHGTADEVVPFWNGESLFLAIPDEWKANPLWIHGAGHNDVEKVATRTDDLYFKSIRFFLLEWVQPRSAA